MMIQKMSGKANSTIIISCAQYFTSSPLLIFSILQDRNPLPSLNHIFPPVIDIDAGPSILKPHNLSLFLLQQCSDENDTGQLICSYRGIRIVVADFRYLLDRHLV